jgi:membrane glycosyltransferase
MKTILRFVALILLAVSIQRVSAAPDSAAQGLFDQLLAATVANDYDGFLALCDSTMNTALTKPIFEAASQKIAPAMRNGYESTYLGELRKAGFAVHLWRIRLKQGGDDLLATLSIKDGKSGGFYIR